MTPPFALWSYFFKSTCIITSTKSPLTHSPLFLRRKASHLLRVSNILRYITLSNKCAIDFFIISMASFWFLLVLVLTMDPCISSLASDHQPTSETSNIITASPATLSTNPPQSLSPHQELSPDISPLLPSPGGTLPAPTSSSMPTIPANPSPPNPDDEFLAPGPDSALSPLGSLPASSRAPANLLQPLHLAAYVALATYCSTHHILRM